MKILLDTHVFLWIITNDNRLTEAAKSMFVDKDNEVYLSLASIWEIAIKVSLGKLTLNSTVEVFINKHVKGNNIKILNIERHHIFAVATLPFYHRDPFDRLLCCQSSLEQIPIVSADKKLDSYPIIRLWDN